MSRVLASSASSSSAEVEVELEAKRGEAPGVVVAAAAAKKNEEEEEEEEKEEEYISIRLMTWNVGNAKPDFGELAHTLSIEELRDTDLVVIGTQENHFKGEHAGLHAKKASVATGMSMRGDEAAGGEVGGEAGGEVGGEAGGEVGSVVGGEAGGEAGTTSPEKPAKAASPSSSPSASPDATASGGAACQFAWLTNLWEVGITEHLGKDWAVVDHSNLGQMKLMVLARTTSGHACTGVTRAKSACGIGGVVPNKGGILTGFHIRNTYLGFMSAHLAAHMEHWATRDANYAEILRETMHAGPRDLDAAVQFDHLFWVGDLNYRVDRDHGRPKDQHHTKEENWAAVKQLIDDKDYAAILQHDQLHHSRARGSAWVGFEEADIAFDPTFKVERSVGPGQYKAKRVPAFCDRVLWRSAPHTQGNVECTMYKGVPLVSTSDHKPVIADVRIKVSTPPPEVYNMRNHGKMLRSQSARKASAAGDGNEGMIAYALEKRRRVWPVVSFSGLKADGIVSSDFGGTSDPYLTFYTNPSDVLWRHPHKTDHTGAAHPPQTAIEPKTLNPRWADEKVPMLHPRVNTDAALDNCSLIISVKDSDLMTADDVLGYVSLRFPTRAFCKDAPVGAQEFSYDFDEPILFEGTTGKSGRLSGNIKVSWTDDMRLTALEWYESEYSDGCKCCNTACTVM
jgi:hypothetical protein